MVGCSPFNLKKPDFISLIAFKFKDSKILPKILRTKLIHILSKVKICCLFICLLLHWRREGDCYHHHHHHHYLGGLGHSSPVPSSLRVR
jgi:hypothetical protein